MGGEGGAKRWHVLVADDEQHIRRLAEIALTRIAREFDVVLAVDGEQALEKIREIRPDLVITDVMMPKMGGFELVDALQADAPLAGIPVIMLSACVQDNTLLQALHAGVSTFVTKPFEPQKFVDVVRGVLGIVAS